VRNVSLRCATKNVAIGEVMAQRLNQAHITNTRVISNWADCDTLVPIAHENNDLRSHWDLSKLFVIGYSGNLGRAHDIVTLIEANEALEKINALKVAHRPVHWLFIGGGHALETLKREVHARKFQSVTFRPYQPRERLSASLSAADVHIVSLKPDLEGLIVPSKFYGIAAAGRTVLNIGDRNGEIAGLIDRHQCGTTIGNGDSAALVAAIVALANDPRRCSDMGQRARTACEVHYSKTAAIDAWSRLLEDVIEENRERDVIAAPTDTRFAPSFDETQPASSRPIRCEANRPTSA
jgi:glycosyltransferase involved in cell wall biosynthesis